MSAPTNRIIITAQNGKRLHTYVFYEGNWHIQDPMPAGAADKYDATATNPDADTTPSGSRLIGISANLAIRMLTDRTFPGLGLGAVVGNLFDEVSNGGVVNKRRAAAFPSDDDGLVRLGDKIPAIAPEKLCHILDGMLAAKVYEIDSAQLTRLITARR